MDGRGAEGGGGERGERGGQLIRFNQHPDYTLRATDTCVVMIYSTCAVVIKSDAGKITTDGEEATKEEI